MCFVYVTCLLWCLQVVRLPFCKKISFLYIAKQCTRLQHTATPDASQHSCHVMVVLQHTAPHTATQCTTMQHIATHSHLKPANKFAMSSSYRSLLFEYCSTVQPTSKHCNALHHNTTHYNTLQHIATRCNTLQHTHT